MISRFQLTQFLIKILNDSKIILLRMSAAHRSLFSPLGKVAKLMGAVVLLAVLGAAGTGAVLLFVIPQFSSDVPNQPPEPSAPNQPSIPSAPNQPSIPTEPSTPTVPSEPPTQPVVGRDIGDLEACTGFLNLDVVISATGHDDLVFNVVRPGESEVRDPDVAIVCTGVFENPDGNKAVTMTILTMDSNNASKSRIANVREEMTDNPEVEVTTGILGENAFQVVINKDEVASMVVVQTGVYVMIFTAGPAGENALASPEQLWDFAKIVIIRVP